jgi:hypothetical protein
VAGSRKSAVTSSAVLLLIVFLRIVVKKGKNGYNKKRTPNFCSSNPFELENP